MRTSRELSVSVDLLRKTENIADFADVYNNKVFEPFTKMQPAKDSLSYNPFMARLELIENTLQEAEKSIEIIHQPSLFPVEVLEPDLAQI
jgi:hypothetical protein